jgi:hypothetical protein
MEAKDSKPNLDKAEVKSEQEDFKNLIDLSE